MDFTQKWDKFYEYINPILAENILYGNNDIPTTKIPYLAEQKIILAILGPSASGKDTLAKELYNKLLSENVDVNIMVPDTTRPRRYQETDGIDYNFISRKNFYDNASSGKYLEWAVFRNWCYGMLKSEVKSKINIGVFNIDGLRKMTNNFSSDYIIIPVYCNANVITRLKRSFNRENKFKPEYLRRVVCDWYDFLDFSNTLEYTYTYYFDFSKEEFSISRMCGNILFFLRHWSFLDNQ